MSKSTPKPIPPPKARSRQKSTTAADLTKRKRELDRIAQRNCRERTKNRISFLEEKVKSLEARNRNSQYSSLVAMQETLMNDNSELRAAMRKILFIADSIVNTSENKSCEKCKHRSSDSEDIGSPEDAPAEEIEQRFRSMKSQEDSGETQQQTSPRTPDLVAAILPGLEVADGQSPCEDVPHDQGPVENDTIFVENKFFNDDTMNLDSIISSNAFMESDLSLIPNSTNFDTELSNWETPPFYYNEPLLFGCSNSDVLRHEEMWMFSDGTFARGLEMTRTAKIVEQSTMHPSVPIQAILWGWNTIDAKTRNHPGWIALREVDEKIFGTWKSKPQKIAMMYVCSLLMQYRAHPTPDNLERVPPWFRPRPSQERIQHPLVIDFLIWPGLRDFLVFNHIAYTQSGEFSERFTEDFHFNWPFPETSVFEFDPLSGQPCFSKLFKKYAFDLSNWTMDLRFFERYPELANDIPLNMRNAAGATTDWNDGLDMKDGTTEMRQVMKVMV